MGQASGADRGIRAQLNRIVLIPSITFVVLFAVLSGATLLRAASLHVATGDGRSGLHLYHALVEIQSERRLAAVYAGAPTDTALRALRDQTTATDEAVRGIDERSEGLRGRGDPDVAEIATAFFTEVGRRGEIRAQAMAEELSADEVITSYTAITDRGVALYDAMTRRLDHGASAAAGADVVNLMRAHERFSRADALLSTAVATGSLAPLDRTRFAALVHGTADRLSTSRPALTGAAADAHDDLTGSAAWERVNDRAAAVADHAPEAAVDPVTGVGAPADGLPPGLNGWRADADDVNADLVRLTDAASRGVITVTDDAGTGMFALALGGGVLAAFAGTIAYGVASRSASRLTARLARLRADTLGVAREELPRIVRRLAAGEPVDLDTELTQLDHGTDEVGQVADAFNTAQRTAVLAAVKQADMRAGVNRVFLAIAHRNQSLVQRQLQLLDRIEREEEDPDLLEDLFHLDHLATRGRRNAENLIILGGAQPGRRWRQPIPLVDILRGAISETEEYSRVKLRVVPDLALTGAVVADVIHLVAELVENATAFSPPHTLVHIHSEVVPKGVVVEIEDRGLGMSEDNLATANATLATAPEFDVMALNQDSRLGLFVVARLAGKHGISVQLCPSPYGGTRAVVLVPAELIATGLADDPAAPPADVVSGPAARHRSGDLLAPKRPAPARRNRPGRGADRPAPAPPAPRPAPPAPADPGGGGADRPVLPRRRRQASLAPQLRGDAAPAPSAAPGSPAPRTPEQARQMMSAFQNGTRRGREDDVLAPDPPTAAPPPPPAGTCEEPAAHPAVGPTGESE
ncbi:sensor histidine kinase [Nocardiopsis trehalosi]|uniref:sensor histidine kinase n=1 Tax=Nocardiopsis trehalosi TaxID=109329 RepID=UPI000A00D96D|nr:nitrate- and nitrite sensing domain-containing protein [Nocardiopsis trehalosi]